MKDKYAVMIDEPPKIPLEFIQSTDFISTRHRENHVKQVVRIYRGDEFPPEEVVHLEEIRILIPIEELQILQTRFRNVQTSIISMLKDEIDRIKGETEG